MRAAVRPEPRAVVRSTLPEAMTVMPAPVGVLLHGALRSEVRERSTGARARATIPGLRVVHQAVRSTVRGEAGTGEARSAPGASRAMPAAGAAGQGERGEDRDERRAKRRREEDAAVVSP